MYKQEMKLERELKITEIYKENQTKNKAIREAKVLEFQTLNSFITHEDTKSTLMCKINRPMVGYFNQLDADGIDKLGYCINNYSTNEELELIKADQSYNQEYVEKVEEMIAFWASENTVKKIHNKFTQNMNRSLADDNFNEASAAIYPLYRLAGTHMNLEKLFKTGVQGLINEVEEKLLTAKEDSKEYYIATKLSLETILQVLKRYEEDAHLQLKSADTKEEVSRLERIETAFKNLQVKAPSNFHECLQIASIFMVAARSSEMGRLDMLLGRQYKKDLLNGILTREQAIADIVSFFDIIAEGIGRDSRCLIGGLGRKDEAMADELAKVIMDAQLLRDGAYLPQLSLRYYEGMDQELWNKAIYMLGQGQTFPILYNDDVNVPTVMRAMDVPKKVAEQYGFFGCGEYMLLNKSIGTPNTLINVAKVVELALNNGVDPVTNKFIGVESGVLTDESTFEELLEAYEAQMQYAVDLAGDTTELIYDVCNEEASCLLISALFDDCIPRGKALLDGGIYQLAATIESYGNITASDSLAAMKEVIFEQKAFTLSHLKEALEANFVGYEEEQALLKSANKFGNDNESADEMAVFVHENLCHGIRNQKLRTRLESFLVVIINNNMNVAMGRNTGATPDGRRRMEFVSNGIGAYNNCDKEGFTALCTSIAKMDTSIHAGANQNMKFSPKMFVNDGKIASASILGFFKMGGQQVNLTVVNQAEIEDAMIHPEKHTNLFIRVGGYTCRFIHLDEPTQREVLSRTAY